MRRRYVLAAVTAALVGASSACGGGGGGAGSSTGAGSSSGGAGSSSGGGGAPAIVLDVQTYPGLPASYDIRHDSHGAAVQALRLHASGGAVSVRALTLHASGTADDAADVLQVRVAADDGDGVFDASKDAFLGAVVRFASDDGAAIVGGIARTLADGASESWWVIYDLAGTARPGATLGVDVLSAQDVDAVAASSGAAASVTGAPARSPRGRVFQGLHLLLSEICTAPSSAEFVEVYNPTPDPIDLSNVRLDCGEARGAGLHYYLRPTGGDFPLNAGDAFHVRFPQGATIAPGAFVVVAPSSDEFQGRYAGALPTYELLQDGAADGCPDMRIEGPAPSATWTPGIDKDGGAIVLYEWDGASDLVRDIDLVAWGDVSDVYVDKTGTQVDGPDSGSQKSAYLADSALLMQDKAPIAASGVSMKRVDLFEYGETGAGGNGPLGHDETSENWSVTWASSSYPNPGSQ